MSALAVFVSLGVLQASLGSAHSALLGPRTPPADTTTGEHAADVHVKQLCRSCVKIDNICYNNTYLLKLDAPFAKRPKVDKIGIMTTSNILYYTFEPKYDDPEYYKVAYVSLDSPKYSGVISGWQPFNFRTFDINQKEKKVYLGGSDGIWAVNSTSSVPSFVAVKGKIINNIVLKDYLYFTILDGQGIIKNVDGYYAFILKDQTIKKFVLDKTVQYNIVYLTDTGLYIMFHSRSQTEPVRLSSESFIRGLSVDTLGTVYAWHVDGIYKVVLGKVLSESTLTRVSDIVPDAMTFDKHNNIVYSVKNKLYKLTKVLTHNCKTL